MCRVCSCGGTEESGWCCCISPCVGDPPQHPCPLLCLGGSLSLTGGGSHLAPTLGAGEEGTVGVSTAGHGRGLASRATSQDCGWSLAAGVLGSWPWVGGVCWSGESPGVQKGNTRPPSQLGLWDCWEQGCSQAASLGFASSGINLPLGLASKFAAALLILVHWLCLHRMGWAGGHKGFLEGRVLEWDLGNGMEFA